MVWKAQWSMTVSDQPNPRCDSLIVVFVAYFSLPLYYNDSKMMIAGLMFLTPTLL